jgi:hypothetical protein
MGCLFALFAGFAPRLAVLFLWIFTPLVDRAFQHTFIWPLLGIIFLPLTTLVYTLAYIPHLGVTGLGWFWIFFALLLDIIAWAGSTYGNREHVPGMAH